MRILISLIVFTALSSTAFAQRSTGLIFMEREQYMSVPPAGLPLRGDAPSYVDLSKDFPVPGSQGSQQSCVGWAVANLKAYQKNHEYRVQGLKSNFSFSPAFIYNQIKHGSCDSGSQIGDALEMMQKLGALPLEAFSYDDKSCDKLPTEAQVQSALEFRIAQWMRVNVQSDTEMKAQLTRGYPIVIGMNIYETFEKHDGTEVYKVDRASAGALRGGHAMVIVGYADQVNAYKVLNSWGADWGVGGYAWVDYATLRSMVREGFVAIDIFHDHVVTASVPANLPKVAATSPVPEPPLKTPTPPPQPKTSDNEPGPVLGAASPSATARAPESDPSVAKTPPLPKTLTTAILEKAVRSTTEPKVLFTTKEKYDVKPYSVWLELPEEMAATVNYVEYSFIAPGFVNPKKSLPDSNIFIAKWRGFGCVTEAHVVVYLKNGKKVYGTFDLCDVQNKT